MFLPKPCLLLLGLLLSSFLIAQQRVSFKIINKNNEPVSFATIIAKNAADTSKSSTRIADSSGTTQLLLNDGTYKIYVQAVNYQAFTKTITVNNLNTAFTFSLSLSLSPSPFPCPLLNFPVPFSLSLSPCPPPL